MESFRKKKDFYKSIIIYSSFMLLLLYSFWIWKRFSSPHRFDFLVISINGRLKTILNKESFTVYPSDRLRILEIHTDVPFNLYVRLYSSQLDIEAFRYKEMPLFSERIYTKKKFRIYVKFKEIPIGYTDCIVKPFFKDWLERYEGIEDVYEKEKYLDEAFSLFPKKKDLLLELKLKLAQQFEKKDIRKAIEEYKEILNLGERSESVYERLAGLYIALKKYREAIRCYEALIDMGKKGPQIYYNLFQLYKNIGNEEKANDYLLKLTRIKPEDIETEIKLANTFLEKGDLEKAEYYVKDILKRRPDSLEALFLLCKILDKKGERDSLRDAYKKILKISEDTTVLYNLAVLEYESNNLDDALSYIKRYLKKRPKDKDAHELLFHIYKEKSLDDMAYEEAKILISIYPDLPDPYYFVFEYMWKKGSCEKVIPLLNRGIRHNPDDLTLRKYLLLCYLKNKKDALAIAEIKNILKIKPDDIDTLFQLARIYEKRGEYERAIKVYKKILEISPENEKAQDAYLRLRLKGLEEEER